MLVDADDALLKVHAGLDGADNFVTRSKDSIEELEFLGEQLVDANIGGVCFVEEVDDDHIVLLAVAVASADALLDALRIPRHIVVHDQIAELEIDALSRGFGGNHDAGFVAEVLDQGGAFVGGGRAGDAVGAGVLLHPIAGRLPGSAGRCWCR